ncbi:MAG: transposase [Acidobacteria bacterium]|nr:transposase [Acidobacteriota bacterium]
MNKEKKHWTPEDKLRLLRLHLIEKQPVSKICQDANLSPPQFYAWQQQLFTNGSVALASKPALDHKHEVPDPNQTKQRLDELEAALRQKDEVIAALLTEHIALKKRVWGPLHGSWVQPETRDQIVDFITHWAERTHRPIEALLAAAGLAVGKFYDWRKRYGAKNQHNGHIPRSFWLEEGEKQRILAFQELHPGIGYRRLTEMMVAADLITASPASVWRVLGQAGRLRQKSASSAPPA